MGGAGGWEGQVDGRGRMMGGAGGWEGQVDGRGRWMGGVGEWEGRDDGRGRMMETWVVRRGGGWECWDSYTG